VATRPPRVAELAEVLAVDFDDGEGIPRLNSDWRWEDQEQALLIACSSLIAIVETGDSRIVQFSHFSVKEFLTSSRLVIAGGEVSKFYIDLVPAHMTLAQACLGVLLQTKDDVEGHTPKDHPLARYAAEHWTTHAQFGEVSSRLHKGMVYLFDANKPHFKVWLTLCNIDTGPDNDSIFSGFFPSPISSAGPLYYAALCGFHNLMEHLIIKHPHGVNAVGGLYARPLVAALAGEHFQTAELLRHNGADTDIQGRSGINPLHAAASSGNLEVVRILIECVPAHVNARNEYGSTPLYWASETRNFNDGSVIRLLHDYGADINLQNKKGCTPLHGASKFGRLETVRLLLELGADVELKDNDGKTALQVATDNGHDRVVELLREHGAK
jgi:Ankyrin repeats (3 copies)/Ankyrin repeats (many copies)